MHELQISRLVGFDKSHFFNDYEQIISQKLNWCQGYKIFLLQEKLCVKNLNKDDFFYYFGDKWNKN